MLEFNSCGSGCELPRVRRCDVPAWVCPVSGALARGCPGPIIGRAGSGAGPPSLMHGGEGLDEPLFRDGPQALRAIMGATRPCAKTGLVLKQPLVGNGPRCVLFGGKRSKRLRLLLPDDWHRLVN